MHASTSWSLAAIEGPAPQNRAVRHGVVGNQRRAVDDGDTGEGGAEGDGETGTRGFGYEDLVLAEVVGLASALAEPLLVLGVRGHTLWANAAATAAGVAPMCEHLSRAGAGWQRLTQLADDMAASLSPKQTHFGRVLLSMGPTRVTISRAPGALAALLGTRRAGRAALGTVLAFRFGLRADEVDVALRLWEGASTADLAGETGLATGTVRWRLHRVRAALGRKTRAEVIALLDDLAASERTAALSETVTPPPTLGAPFGVLGALQALLEHAEPALALVGADATLRWANAGARAVLNLRGPQYCRCPGAVTLARTVAGSRAAAADNRTRLARVSPQVVAASWRATDRLAGVRLFHAPLDDASLVRRLRATSALTARQAEIAVRLAAGESTATLAARLGLAKASIRGVVSQVCARTGASGRQGLTDLMQRLRGVDQSLPRRDPCGSPGGAPAGCR
jgi:DNA-binding CsgD family transcriptional regulator